MTAMLPFLHRRPKPGPIITEIPIRCDRESGCAAVGHPWHIARVETVHCGVADIAYRVTAVLAGQKMRAPWNFSDRTEAVTKHSELVAAFRNYAAAAETLAGAR